MCRTRSKTIKKLEKQTSEKNTSRRKIIKFQKIHDLREHSVALPCNDIIINVNMSNNVRKTKKEKVD